MCFSEEKAKDQQIAHVYRPCVLHGRCFAPFESRTRRRQLKHYTRTVLQYNIGLHLLPHETTEKDRRRFIDNTTLHIHIRDTPSKSRPIIDMTKDALVWHVFAL